MKRGQTGPIRSPAGWVPDLSGIYFIEPSGRISYHRLATGRRQLPRPPTTRASSTTNWHCRPTDAGCCTRSDSAGADIVLVENFR